jgi:hypothetical protein
MTMFSMAGNTPDRTLSLIYVSGNTATVPESHPRFDELLNLVLSGAEDEEVSDLVDVMLAVTKRVSQLSERVSVKGRTVLFDGDPIHGELSEVLFELFEAGNPESMRPVVNFLEKASTNPSGKSVDDLYRWITKGDLIIHEDGDFLAYKGCRIGDDGVRTSINSSGTAFVNGEEFSGYIPNPDGAVVTMPRSDVDDNMHEACSTGLHAGTYAYAKKFLSWHSGPQDMVLVKINPRDVVSVPTDDLDQKLRTCRYVVQEVVEERRSSRVYVQEELPTPSEDELQDAAQPVIDAINAIVDALTPVTDTEDEEEDFDPFEDDEDEDEDEDMFLGDSSEFVQHLSSNEALETLRQKLLSSEDMEYQYSGPTEAEKEVEEANTVIRDSKGRFTKDSAVNAVRNSKGQFTKRS